jgi:hypothetical protein
MKWPILSSKKTARPLLSPLGRTGSPSLLNSINQLKAALLVDITTRGLFAKIPRLLMLGLRG